MFFAHSSKRQDRSDWHLLAEHLKTVATNAAENAKKFGAGDWGHILGLLHDVGKYSPEFQIERLEKEDGRRIDHSTVGAKIAHDRYKPLGKLLAFCLAGHHAGLANGTSGEAITALIDRLDNTDIPELDPVWQKEITLPGLPPLPNLEKRKRASDDRGVDRAGFQFAFFTRMLFSCLIDADRRDTVAFLQPPGGIETFFRRAFD